jgi:hypothetical protein
VDLDWTATLFFSLCRDKKYFLLKGQEAGSGEGRRMEDLILLPSVSL